MRKTPFIWIGSGRAKRRNVPGKGLLLDQAARSGLPVPPGGILLDEFYQICLDEEVIELVGNSVIVPDPVWLHEVLFRDIRFPRLEKAVAVRPAAAQRADDGSGSERARLNVDLNDPEQMAEAVRTVWSIMQGMEDEAVHDVLVMEMVEVQVAGEVLTAVEHAVDEIHIFEGFDDELQRSYSLEKIGTFQRASAEGPLYTRRLQKLLRGVRRSLGKGTWRIEWADDGEICWLLQIE